MAVKGAVFAPPPCLYFYSIRTALGGYTKFGTLSFRTFEEESDLLMTVLFRHGPVSLSLPILPKSFSLVVSCFVLALGTVVPQRLPAILCRSFMFLIPSLCL